MVAKDITYTPVIAVSLLDVSLSLWEDLTDNPEEAAQFVGENFIEQNLLFIMDATQDIQGQDALIGYEEHYDGTITLNFNTYFSEN